MNNDKEEIVHSKKVLEMVTVANEICIFLEEISRYDKDYILLYLQKVLPLLYLKGSLLPAIDAEDESANERYITEEQWENIFNSIRLKLGADDKFYILDNDDPLNLRSAKASIAENLADIYQDLKDFVLLYAKNSISARENAVSECRKNFGTGWGMRIVYAHAAIHQLIFAEAHLPGNSDFSMN